MVGQLSLFAGRKQRGVKPPAPLEQSLHFQTADIVRRWLKPDWRCTHFPAGELRHPATANRLKRMGLQRGWADFLLLPPYPDLRLHQLELKRRGMKLTDAQQAMQQFCVFNGYPYRVCYDLDEVLAVLREWGAVRLSVSETRKADG